MDRVFKTRAFARWARKNGLRDSALCAAVDEMAAGLFDADLGGGVLKKRIGLNGRGKFFVVGFEKNERSNIGSDELEALQALASDLLVLTKRQLDKSVADGALQEICK